MKLYDFYFAPNPRKVRVFLAEKGIEVPLETVDFTQGENRTPEFLAKNPMGSVPVLELDDGSFLTESLAIIEYLDELHPDPPMIGTAPLERARVRELERLAEAGVFNRVARIFFHTSPVFAKARRLPEIAELAREGLPHALRVLDARIGESPFAAGDRPTIADCTLFAAFEHGRLAGMELGTGFENLARWYRAFRERPSARA